MTWTPAKSNSSSDLGGSPEGISGYTVNVLPQEKFYTVITLISILAIAPLASAYPATSPSAFAQADTIEPRLLQYPSIHKDTLVFGYAGDLWVSSTTDGAIARRLTSHQGLEARPRISPDGKWVAFTGQYDGGDNIYVVPIEGGEPRRVTFDAEPDQCVGWTPDGKIMYASAAGTEFNGRQTTLYIVDPKGGLPKKTVLNEFAVGTFFADGQTIAYNRSASYAFSRPSRRVRQTLTKI